LHHLHCPPVGSYRLSPRYVGSTPIHCPGWITIQATLTGLQRTYIHTHLRPQHGRPLRRIQLRRNLLHQLLPVLL